MGAKSFLRTDQTDVDQYRLLYFHRVQNRMKRGTGGLKRIYSEEVIPIAEC